MLKLLKNLLKNLGLLKEKRLKMYVLVRGDLSETYRCVQGGHALASYSTIGDPKLYKSWGNQTLVYLKVSNEHFLALWRDRLRSKSIPFGAFYEPDLNDQLTAIACISTGEIFRKLPLA